MQRILVGRYLSLVDFIQAWPSLAMLKASLPNAFVVALVPSYVAPLVKVSPWLDDAIVDLGADASAHDKERLVQIIHAHQFDAAINAYANYHSASLGRRAKIPYRLGPARGLVRFLYTDRFALPPASARLPDEVPEGYHTYIMHHFLAAQRIAVVPVTRPYLSFSAETLQAQRAKLAQQLGLNPRKQWFMVHVGNGTLSDLNLPQYAQLLNKILKNYVYIDIILSATPTSMVQTMALKELLDDDSRVAMYADNDGLVDFARSVACANVFIGGESGGLQAAGALDVPTIGFFSVTDTVTGQPKASLNSLGRHLALYPDMINGKTLAYEHIDHAYQDITAWLKQSQFQSINLHT